MRLFCLILATAALLCGCSSDASEITKDSGAKKDTRPPIRRDSDVQIDQKIEPDLCGPSPKCAAPQQACPNPVCPACVTLGSDEHCGGCNDSCNVAHGYACSGGKCACKSGLIDCLGLCVDTNKDNNNCGQCGKACSVDDGLTCVVGSCRCTVSGAACDDAGVDAGPKDAAVDLVADQAEDLPADTVSAVDMDTGTDTSVDSDAADSD